MKDLRMEKLAQLKKMAEEQKGPLTTSEVSNIKYFLENKRKSLGQEYVDSAVGNIANQTYLRFISENNSKIILNPMHQDSFKKYIISYIVFYLLSSITPETLPIKMIRPGMGLSGNAEQLEELQLALGNAIAESRLVLPDPEQWNDDNNKEEKDGGTQSSGGGSAKSSVINHPANTKLRDSNYLYEVMDPNNSFEWIDLKNKTKQGTFNLSKMGIPKWNQAVAALNALTPEPSATTATTPATATPAIPATPETTAAPVTPAATGLDQSLVQKVAAVLQKAMLYPLNVRSLQNEQDQIRSLANKLNGLTGLAAIIVSKVGENLTTLSAATLAKINSSTRKELAVNMGGEFAGDVGTILIQINEISKIGNRSPTTLQQMAKSITITQAPVTPPVTPVTKASASLDKKFVKAATLRRMRIRSQMEAAVDSSAQMGRSRVF